MLVFARLAAGCMTLVDRAVGAGMEVITARATLALIEHGIVGVVRNGKGVLLNGRTGHIRRMGLIGQPWLILRKLFRQGNLEIAVVDVRTMVEPICVVGQRNAIS